MMYQPYFQWEKRLKQQSVLVFSSNYELYGDLSQRMHHLLSTFAVDQEIYSIDESFLDFRGMPPHNFTDYGRTIKRTVMKHLGLPVAVGIGPSKTLAKAANNRAKKVAAFEGVLVWPEISSQQDQLLSGMGVQDIWGVGRKWGQRLQQVGICTALDLKRTPSNYIRQHFNVILERTVLELNGIPCQALELVTPNKQEIVCSRAFSEMITDYTAMQQAVSRYVARAAEKLRAQQGVCKQVSVGITTNPFKTHAPQYQNWASTRLIHPSNHTSLLIDRAGSCLQRIWRDGYAYKKAFVMLSEIGDGEGFQADLFATSPRYSNNPKGQALMTVLDDINQRMGKGACRLAAEGLDGKVSWPMQRHRQSNRYTTSWKELPWAYLK